MGKSELELRNLITTLNQDIKSLELAQQTSSSPTNSNSVYNNDYSAVAGQSQALTQRKQSQRKLRAL